MSLGAERYKAMDRLWRENRAEFEEACGFQPLPGIATREYAVLVHLGTVEAYHLNFWEWAYRKTETSDAAAD